ncbi:unnamed protein product [Penicillium pancosmium]
MDDDFVQRITDCISRGVLMYSIVLSDPSFTVDPSPGWKDVISNDGYSVFRTGDKILTLKDILQYRLNLRDDGLAVQEERSIGSGGSLELGKYLGFYVSNVEASWGLGLIDDFKVFHVSELVGVLKQEKKAEYMTPKERELTA